MFEWIRRKVKESVLAGMADAADYLAGQAPDDAQTGQDRLETRLRLLPAWTPVVPEDKPKRSKAS